ncbi:DUF4012 domain-containing protein [Microbacterium gallinarum]|uniref:DUF4012 domain-containing protein n=1 Tax=Microbacterium gallinarum TaxID=2762209 RepID=A0ABR8X382_9MICO|nr:DUF4012 domain-containing protein [Microbacterium gallinarum]MBD8023753.1 DUF4012 domain-containing protein [Microbacterium gallinarum]
MHPDDTPVPAEGSLRRHARDAVRTPAPTTAELFGDPAEDAPQTKRKRRVWPWIVIGAVLLVGVVAGVLAMQFLNEVKTAQGALERAKSDLSTLSTGLGSADQAQVQATADDITKNVTLAADIVEGPLWNLAAQVPFVGQNVDAVQRVTRAVDILVDRALPPGLQFMSTIDPESLTVEGGGINLEPFRQVQASIPEIADAFADAQAEVAPIDSSTLMPQVADPIAEITTILDQASPALSLAEGYLPTLLDMAGSGGKKTYLVIFQNNAEIRATGGNPAASMILTVTDGKLGYADQASSATFYEAGTQGNEYVSLPPETTGLYLPTLTRHSQDYTFTPDFPTTAQLFQAVWANTTGANFDGVISIDPVVLSHMLAVAGPVTLTTGEQLTAENAVSVLLSQAYERFPDARASDFFFADTAKRVFDHLTSASWDPMKMLKALELSAQEQRVNLAFTNPDAQALAVELGVDGALAPDTVEQTQVGIYLNNSSVSKLDYHLTSAITATCDAPARTMTTTMTLHNSITDDIRSGYTLGWRNGGFGLPRTTMMLDVLFFAPPGAQITQTVPATGDAPNWDRSGVEKGNTALSRTVFVPKDETVTVSHTVAFPEGELGPLNLRHTPTASSTAVTIDPSCDALFPKAD